MKWKIFQWMKFLFRHFSDWQENWAGRNFITNSRVYSLLITQAKMQTEINNKLTDGGVSANRNSANHPYCFLSNQKEVQILAFLHLICKRNVSCPPSEHRLQRWRERAWSQSNRTPTVRLTSVGSGNRTWSNSPKNFASRTQSGGGGGTSL